MLPEKIFKNMFTLVSHMEQGKGGKEKMLLPKLLKRCLKRRIFIYQNDLSKLKDNLSASKIINRT